MGKTKKQILEENKDLKATVDFLMEEKRELNTKYLELDVKWFLAIIEIDGRWEVAEPQQTLRRAAEVVIARMEQVGNKDKTLGILVRKKDGTDVGWWAGFYDGEKVRKC